MSKRNQNRRSSKAKFTTDGYDNFVARLGKNQTNLSGYAGYTPNYTSRKRIELEFAYRGSFLIGKAVDTKAKDMTRKGVSVTSGLGDIEKTAISRLWRDLGIWKALKETLQWGSLYGGAIAVMLVEGQNPSTPLRLGTVGRDQFRGLLVLDRWQLDQTEGERIADVGPDIGKRKYYQIVPNAIGIPTWKVHHSRVIRFDGDVLPYQQRLYENGWGQSVIERIIDRIEAYDSVTQGAAQLIYKAHLRTYSVEKLREILALGGPAEESLMKHMDMIRMYQSIEGMTIMDAKDTFETHTYAFGGLAEVMDKFSEQIAGAVGIPLIRLLGQSPKGFSTGDADLANYYDEINSEQDDKLTIPCQKIFELSHRSLFGKPLPEDFDFTYPSLWQMSDEQKAAAGKSITDSLIAAYEVGAIDRVTALREMRQSSRTTGMWSTISEEDITEAENDPPPMGELPDADNGSQAPSESGENQPD